MRKLVLVSFALTAMARLALADSPAPTSQPAPDPRQAFRQLDVTSPNMTIFDYAIYAPEGVEAPRQLKSALVDLLKDDASQILNISPDEVSKSLNMYVMKKEWVGTHVVFVALNVGLNLNADARPAAGKFMDRVVQLLPQVLEDIPRIRLDDQANGIQNKLREAEAEEAQIADELNASYGLLDTTPDDVHALAHKLDEERQSASIDKAAMEDRRQALAAKVDELTKLADNQSQNDPVSKELEKIANLRQDQFNEMKGMPPNTVGAKNLGDAEIAAAEAQAQLLERREEVARAAGGDTLTDLKQELVKLDIDMAEAEGRRVASQHAADQLRGMVSEVDRLQQDRDRQVSLRSELQQLESQLDDLENQSPPTVTVEATN
jgi:hypothetical protein